MKSKKFVLAGLVLLAIIMVLLPLSGCKNDTVPETPKYQVTFDVGGNREATAPASITVERGAKLTAEQVPVLPETSSYQFLGWYLGDTKIEAGYTVTEPVTVTARWQGWLTFTAEGEQSLSTIDNGMAMPVLMEYSTDGGQTWSKLSPATAIFFGNGTKLYLRAKSSVGTEIPKNESLYGVDFVQFAFRDGTRVQAAGDIRTLVDWENPTEVATSNARFGKLFMDCVELVTAPELPAMELADRCYVDMFSGCEKLSSVTMLATDVNVFYALDRWLDGTAEGGTHYVANEEMTTDPTITGSLPTDKNWTVEVAATN